jgi:hypothetical protein
VGDRAVHGKAERGGADARNGQPECGAPQSIAPFRKTIMRQLTVFCDFNL